MEPVDLFKESLEWLKDHYSKYEFFTERDIVWTIQTHLRDRVKQLKLPYMVLNDWPMEKGKRRSLCADLTILQNNQVRLIAEFKYEPDHDERKEDFSENKLKQSIVFWTSEHSVEADITRIKQFSANKEINNNIVGVAVFIDEGGRFYNSQKTFPGSRWEKWNKKTATLISWSNDCDFRKI